MISAFFILLVVQFTNVLDKFYVISRYTDANRARPDYQRQHGITESRCTATKRSVDGCSVERDPRFAQRGATAASGSFDKRILRSSTTQTSASNDMLGKIDGGSAKRTRGQAEETTSGDIETKEEGVGYPIPRLLNCRINPRDIPVQFRMPARGLATLSSNDVTSRNAHDDDDDDNESHIDQFKFLEQFRRPTLGFGKPYSTDKKYSDQLAANASVDLDDDIKPLILETSP